MEPFIDLQNAAPIRHDGDFYTALGSYWSEIFEDAAVVETLLKAVQDLAVQSDINLKEVVAARDLANAPLLHTQVWFRQTLYKDEMSVNAITRNRYGEGDLEYGQPGLFYGDSYVWSFHLPQNMLVPTQVANRVTSPSFLGYQGKAYITEPGLIGFYFNPFTASEHFPVFSTERGEAINVWYYLSLWDGFILQNTYGPALNVAGPTSTSLHTLLQGVWNGRVWGPSQENIYDIVSGGSGVPLCKSNGEIVELIRTQGDEKLVVTNKHVYTYPASHAIAVDVGDVLHAGQGLTDALQLVTDIQSGGEDVYLPASYFDPRLQVREGILFPNRRVPVEDRGLDADGNRLVHFSVGGNSLDVDNYLKNACALGLSKAVDTRGPLASTQPNPEQLKATVNPAVEIAGEIINGRIVLVYADKERWPKNDLHRFITKEADKLIPKRGRLLMQNAEVFAALLELSSQSQSSNSSSSFSQSFSSRSSNSSSSSSRSSNSSLSSLSSHTSSSSTSLSSQSISSLSSTSHTSSSYSSDTSSSFSSQSSVSSRSTFSSNSSSSSSGHLSASSISSNSSSTSSSSFSSVSSPSSTSSSSRSDTSSSNTSSSLSTPGSVLVLTSIYSDDGDHTGPLFAAPVTSAVIVGFSTINPVNDPLVYTFPTGSRLSWDYNPLITSFVLGGGNVYLFGPFSSYDGLTRIGAAAFTAASTMSILPWDPEIVGEVNGSAYEAGLIYIAGLFTSVDSTSRLGLACINDLGDLQSVTYPRVNDTGAVRDLKLIGDNLLVAGDDFSSISRVGLIVAHKTTGALGVNTTPSLFPASTHVHRIVECAGKIFLTGNFTAVGAVVSDGIVRVDPTTMTLDSWSVGAAYVPAYDPDAFSDGTQLFVKGNDGLYKIDPSSGAILWSTASYASPCTVYGSTLIGYYRGELYEFDTSTGVIADARMRYVELSSYKNGHICLVGRSLLGSGTPGIGYIGPSGSLLAFSSTTQSIDETFRSSISLNTQHVELIPDGRVITQRYVVSEYGQTLHDFGPSVYTGSNKSIILLGGYIYVGNLSTGLRRYDATTYAQDLGFNWDLGGSFDLMSNSELGELIICMNTASAGRIALQTAHTDVNTRAAKIGNDGVYDFTQAIATTGGSSSISDLLLDGDKLWVGGNFLTLNGVSRPYIGQYDTTASSITSWVPQLAPNTEVRKIVKSGSYILASINGAVVHNDKRYIEIVRYHETTGNILPVYSSASGVSRMTVDATSGDVYIAASTARNYQTNTLSTLDPVSGVWLPHYVSSQIISVVHINGDSIYIAGDYTSIMGSARVKIAEVSITTGLLTSWVSAVSLASTTIYNLTSTAASLYILGFHSGSGYLELSRTTGAQTTNVTLSITSQVFAGSYDNGTDLLYLFGAFTSVGGTARLSIAAIHVSTNTLNSFDPASNTTLNRRSVYDPFSGNTYLSGLTGSFTIGGTSRTRAAVIDSTGVLRAWTIPGDSTGGDLIFAQPGTGRFVHSCSTAGGSAVRIYDSTGTLLGSPYTVTGSVQALGFVGSGVLLNNFTLLSDTDASVVLQLRSGTVNSQTVYMIPEGTKAIVYLATANGIGTYGTGGIVKLTSGSLDVDTSFDVSTNGTVRALAAANGSSVYMGGNFTSIKGVSRNYIAKVNASGAVDTGFDATVPVGGDVYAIASSVADTELYVHGRYTAIGGLTPLSIGRYTNKLVNATGANVGAFATASLSSTLTAGSEIRLVLNGSKVILGGPAGEMISSSVKQVYAYDTTTGSGSGWSSGFSHQTTGSFAYSGTWVTLGNAIYWPGASANTLTIPIANVNNFNGSLYALAGCKQFFDHGIYTYACCTGAVIRFERATRAATTFLAVSAARIAIEGNNLFLAVGTEVRRYLLDTQALVSTYTFSSALLDMSLLQPGTVVACGSTNNVTFSRPGATSYAKRTSDGAIMPWKLPAGVTPLAMAYGDDGFIYVSRNSGTKLVERYSDATGVVDAAWSVSIGSTGNTVTGIHNSLTDVYVHGGGTAGLVVSSVGYLVVGINKSTEVATGYFTAVTTLVNKVILESGTLYAVGTFTTVNSTTRNRAAAVNLSNVLQAWNPNLNSTGRDIAIADSTAYVVGAFTTVNGSVSRNGFAAFDLVNGTVTSLVTSSGATRYRIVAGATHLHIDAGLSVNKTTGAIASAAGIGVLGSGTSVSQLAYMDGIVYVIGTNVGDGLAGYSYIESSLVGSYNSINVNLTTGVAAVGGGKVYYGNTPNIVNPVTTPDSTVRIDYGDDPAIDGDVYAGFSYLGAVDPGAFPDIYPITCYMIQPKVTY